MPTDSPPNTPGRMPGQHHARQHVPATAAEGAHRVLPDRRQRTHRVPGADHDREVGGQERDEDDARLVGGEQQDRDRHDRDGRDGPGQLGQRAEDVGEHRGPTQQDAGDHTRHGGEREAGEDADQRLPEVQPVVRGAEPVAEGGDDLGDRRQRVEPQPEPNVVGGQHLPERRPRRPPRRSAPATTDQACVAAPVRRPVAPVRRPRRLRRRPARPAGWSYRTRQGLLVVDDGRAGMRTGVALRRRRRCRTAGTSAPSRTQTALSANHRVPNSASGT